MPQFNRRTLARVLSQVQRETLLNAVEDAELLPLFSSFETDTIKELGQMFNFLANLSTFGPEKLLQELSKERPFEQIDGSATEVALRNFTISVALSFIRMLADLAGLKDLIDAIDQRLSEFEVQSIDHAVPATVFDQLNFAINRIESVIFALGGPGGNVNLMLQFLRSSSDNIVTVRGDGRAWPANPPPRRGSLLPFQPFLRKIFFFRGFLSFEPRGRPPFGFELALRAEVLFCLPFFRSLSPIIPPA